MVILAVDTTSRTGGFALARNGHVIESVALEADDGFGQILYQQIENLLANHQLKIPDIDGYAAASGPGSFTGIRVGMTAIKALAEANGKQVVAVSNLLAMAEAGQGKLRAPLLDARREQIYAAVYDGALTPLIDECVITWPELLNLIGQREVTFLAQSEKLFETGGPASLPAIANSAHRQVVLTEPLAAAVARVATRAFERGEAVPPEAIDANYVRRAEAELKWRDPR